MFVNTIYNKMPVQYSFINSLCVCLHQIKLISKQEKKNERTKYLTVVSVN